MNTLTFDRWDFLGTRLVLGLIALGATGIGVVVALLRLLSHIEAQRPFAYAAVRSLRIIGATLLGGAVLVTLAGSFANAAVLDAAVDLQGGATTFGFDFGTGLLVAAAGLVCAALAEAFAHGIKLADDVEGLV